MNKKILFNSIVSVALVSTTLFLSLGFLNNKTNKVSDIENQAITDISDYSATIIPSTQEVKYEFSILPSYVPVNPQDLNVAIKFDKTDNNGLWNTLSFGTQIEYGKIYSIFIDISDQIPGSYTSIMTLGPLSSSTPFDLPSPIIIPNPKLEIVRINASSTSANVEIRVSEMLWNYEGLGLLYKNFVTGTTIPSTWNNVTSFEGGNGTFNFILGGLSSGGNYTFILTTSYDQGTQIGQDYQTSSLITIGSVVDLQVIPSTTTALVSFLFIQNDTTQTNIFYRYYVFEQQVPPAFISAPANIDGSRTEVVLNNLALETEYAIEISLDGINVSLSQDFQTNLPITFTFGAIKQNSIEVVFSLLNPSDIYYWIFTSIPGNPILYEGGSGLNIITIENLTSGIEYTIGLSYTPIFSDAVVDSVKTPSFSIVALSFEQSTLTQTSVKLVLDFDSSSQAGGATSLDLFYRQVLPISVGYMPTTFLRIGDSTRFVSTINNLIPNVEYLFYVSDLPQQTSQTLSTSFTTSSNFDLAFNNITINSANVNFKVKTNSRVNQTFWFRKYLASANPPTPDQLWESGTLTSNDGIGTNTILLTNLLSTTQYNFDITFDRTDIFYSFSFKTISINQILFATYKTNVLANTLTIKYELDIDNTISNWIMIKINDQPEFVNQESKNGLNTIVLQGYNQIYLSILITFVSTGQQILATEEF